MKVLKDWAEAERADWDALYDGGSCSCHISPPCGSCTHPGNPLNQEFNDDCWEVAFDLDEACERAMERIRRHIDASVLFHLMSLEHQRWLKSQGVVL